MRVRALICFLASGTMLFFACGRSDMEDDLLFGGVDGGGVGSTLGGGTGGIVSGGGSGGTVVGGSGGIITGGFGGIVTGGSGGIPIGGAGGITGGTGGISVGGFGGIVTGGAGGVTGGTGGISVGGSGGIVTGGTGGFGGFGGFPTDGSFFDTFPFPDSGPIFECVSCAQQNCESQVNACFNNPACAQGVVCAATSCGGFNLQCILQCFGGNFQAGLQAFQTFICLASNCGQECIGAIIGGGGPGGGGGPVPPPAPSSSESFTPRAGGFYGNVSPDEAAATGMPAGPVYIPPVEVLDAIDDASQN
jgi:hypothetical protein